MTINTAVAGVQERFLKAVEEHGIDHVLRWIDSWYHEVAHAKLEDGIADTFGDKARLPENKDGLVLFFTQQVAQAGSRLSRKSTSAGTNLMLEAEVAQAAERLDMLSRGDRARQWDEFFERVKSQTAS